MDKNQKELFFYIFFLIFLPWLLHSDQKERQVHLYFPKTTFVSGLSALLYCWVIILCIISAVFQVLSSVTSWVISAFRSFLAIIWSVWYLSVLPSRLRFNLWTLFKFRGAVDPPTPSIYLPDPSDTNLGWFTLEELPKLYERNKDCPAIVRQITDWVESNQQNFGSVCRSVFFVQDRLIVQAIKQEDVEEVDY